MCTLTHTLSLTQTHIRTHNYRYTGAATKASQQGHMEGHKRYVFQGIYHLAHGEQNSRTVAHTAKQTWRRHNTGICTVSHTLRRTPEKQSQITRAVSKLATSRYEDTTMATVTQTQGTLGWVTRDSRKTWRDQPEP